MKTTLALAFLFAAQIAATAAETAYTALRAVGKQEGSGALNRVVELRARFGSPEPDVWKVILDEPGARGGFRELEVQRGRIISERTPTARSMGAPMNFNQLNLDSEGAFTVANQEAQRAQIPFDRVDYVLRSGTRGGAPVWLLELIDGRRGRVGAIEISADSGTVLRADLDKRGVARREELPPEPRYREEDDQRYVEERGEPRERRYREDGREEREDEAGPGIRDPRHFFNRVGRHFERRGNQLKNFFSGH